MRHWAMPVCGAVMLMAGAAQAQAQAPNADVAAFRAGKTLTYSSLGHVKADRVTVAFKYPDTWGLIDVGVDIDGQGVISPDKNQICMVIIREDLAFQAAAFKLLFASEEDVHDLTPDDSAYVSSQPLTLAGRPSVEILSETPATSDDDVPLRTMANFIGDDGMLVSFQCMTSGDDMAQATAAFDKGLPLFRLMATSLVIQSK